MERSQHSRGRYCDRRARARESVTIALPSGQAGRLAFGVGRTAVARGGARRAAHTAHRRTAPHLSPPASRRTDDRVSAPLGVG